MFQGSPAESLNDKPTRWQGRKTIDHVYCNNWAQASDVDLLTSKLSDHIPMQISLQHEWSSEATRTIFESQALWQKPAPADSTAWQTLLQDIWRKNSQTAASSTTSTNQKLMWILNGNILLNF